MDERQFRHRCTTVMCLVAAASLLVTSCNNSPSDALSDLVHAAEGGDWGTVYDLTDSSSLIELEPWLEQVVTPGSRDLTDPTATDGNSGRDLFVYAFETTEGLGDMLFLHGDFSIGDSVVAGDTAHVTISDDSGQSRQVPMVREDGKWKLLGKGAFPLGLPMSPPEDY